MRPWRSSPTRSAGQTGCLRAGVYHGDVKVDAGRERTEPRSTITSFPGERATVRGTPPRRRHGQLRRRPALDLDGRNPANLPSPTINGDDVVFRDNDVTNGHTTICFVLGSTTSDAHAAR